MPILDITVGGERVRGFVCGRGLRSCYVCGRLSTKQCDYLPRPRPSTQRCDRHLCDQHATVLGPDKDACPEHAPVCLAALERLRAARP